MPHLRKQTFKPNEPPHDLRPDEKVFYCKITGECFRDYEAFFERIILCNSLVWSCSVTGRSGLTYQEAVECERRAQKHLDTFPKNLQKPILYLVTLTHRSRLVDLNDDIFVFAKDRYFIGEEVNVVTGGGERKTLKIVGVIPPPPTRNGDVIVINDDSDDDSKGTPSEKSSPLGSDAEKYEYLVQEEDEESNAITTVSASQISRKRGEYTRDKSKLFLKQHCYPEMGIWKVKENKLRELNLGKAQFEDFFAGTPPAFAVSTAKKKRGKFNASGSAHASPEENKLDRRQKKMMGNSKMNKVEVTPTEPKMMSPEERANMKEQMRQEKLAMKEDMKKKIEEAKQKRKEEKAKEREKVREEKRHQAEILKEWSRPREDMECDDLKEMPQFPAVRTRLPLDLFGDAVMVLEFISDFKLIFDYKQFFPKGFTWGMLESAIMDSDVDGPLCDLLQMLLVAIFNLQEEEAEELQEMEKEEQNNQDKGENRDEYGEEEELSANIMIESATTIALQQQQTHGMPLKEMLLDQYTLTEILRLHLLTSGAKANYKNARFRYQQRGGYTSMDDAGLNLRLEDPGLIRSLGTDNVFDLQPDKKLKLINTLLQQILSYAAVRDFMEESYERLRLYKYDLKQMQWAEQRREKEEAHAKYKKRMEEKNREREKRIEYLKQQEELRKTELNGDRDSPTPDSLKKGKGRPPLNDDQDTPSPLMPDFDDGLTSEEREALRIKEEEEEARKKAEFAKKENEMIDKILENQRTNAMYPLGRDRHYRRYWLFSAMRGVFVEDDEQYLFNTAVLEPEVGAESLGIPQLTRVDEKSTSSDKENDLHGVKAGPGGSRTQQVGGDVVVISDSESEPHQAEAPTELDEAPPELESFPDRIISRRCQGPQWMYLESEEQLVELMASLNPRGFREGQLRQVLADVKTVLSRSIKECPKADLSWQPEATEDSRVKALSLTRGISSRKTAQNLVQNSRASESLELNLRDLLLDLEERLFCGSLGFLKVRDRNLWRTALEHGSYDPQTDDPTFARVEPKPRPEGEADVGSSASSSESVAKDLARALCQLRRGIEPKFLIPPMGEDSEASRSKKRNKERKKPKEEKECDAGNDETEGGEDSVRRSVVERWEESLLQCSSLAQVYLHLSTLEKSVAWSRSALHARCRICRRKGDAERMLLCDGCDRGHHTYCLKPPVEKVPDGDWFCPDCRPKESRRSPRKGKRRTFSDELSEEEEENDDEEADEEADEEDSDAGASSRLDDDDAMDTSTADPNENLCSVCGKEGMLLCCDSCPRSFHMNCAKPPLKKVPKGKWVCQFCTRERMGKIKLGRPEAKKPGRVGRPPGRKSTPRTSPVPSSSSSRRRSSPAPSTSSGSRKRASLDVEDDEPKGKRRSGPKTPTSSLQDVEGGPKHYVSSYRGNFNVQQLKNCEELVNEIIKHADAWPFLKPVSKKLVPDYYDVIKNPMDLSTIRNKIHRYGYTEAGPMIEDVRLIFANCLEYNNRNTPEYKAGVALSRYFERRLKELGLDPGNTPIPATAAATAASKKGRKS